MGGANTQNLKKIQPSLFLHAGQKTRELFDTFQFEEEAEYLLRVARLEDNEHGFKIGGWDTNNLCHTEETTLIAENARYLEVVVVKVKEHSGEKNGTKTKLRKTN